jgi:hypothetical protein
LEGLRLQGYIKLYRKLLCNPIFKNPYLLQLFIYCLLKANHAEGKAFYGSDEITLKPGQFVTGRFELSAALGGNASSTYKRLKRLESLSILGLQSNNKNTLVTVLNWESYQVDKIDLDNEVTADGQESNRKVTTKGQQSNTNKNDKNVKNDKNNISNIFVPPTLEEVQAYCKERNNGVDAQRWYDFYLSKGWMVGKNKMKDWKAAVRTWEKGGVQSGTNKQPNGQSKPNPGYDKSKWLAKDDDL